MGAERKERMERALIDGITGQEGLHHVELLSPRALCGVRRVRIDGPSQRPVGARLQPARATKARHDVGRGPTVGLHGLASRTVAADTGRESQGVTL